MTDRARQEELLRGAKRLLALREAQDDMLRFMKLTMPHPDDPEDVEASLYQETPQARLLCQIIEKVERGELKRVAVSIGPQMGKSQILSRGAPAWISGRNPFRNIMLGTYNQDFANEFGDEVRAIMQSRVYRNVFAEHELRKGAQAKDLLITTKGGKMAFVGVGGSGTGKPADFFIVDDPIRNDEDAQSALYRDRLWKWFNSVALTRCHGGSGIVVVHTRWHEDDLIGRLCDPEHPERNKAYKGVADRWTYINLPAVVDDPKLAKALGLTLEEPDDAIVVEQFGRRPMSSLWPGRKPLSFLAEAKQMDPRTFGALYMGQPSPDDGAFFKMNDIVEYEAHELPADLRKYGASDHAVSTKQGRDFTVVGCVGIDQHDDIWVLPDVFWDRVETDRTVEELMHQMRAHHPLLWWMESELISKSFGPFLRKRMSEERVYCSIESVRPSKDKMTRARAIQGRMQMRRVHFPRFAAWWPDAKAQLLKFPNATNDDFVDWLAHIGQGLTKEVRASGPKTANDNAPRSGTIRWILQDTKKRALRDRAAAANAGW